MEAVARLAIDSRFKVNHGSRFTFDEVDSSEVERCRFFGPALEIAPWGMVQFKLSSQVSHQGEVGIVALSFRNAGGKRFFTLKTLFHNFLNALELSGGVSGATRCDQSDDCG